MYPHIGTQRTFLSIASNHQPGTSLQLGNRLRRMLRLVWHTRPKVFSFGYLWWVLKKNTTLGAEKWDQNEFQWDGKNDAPRLETRFSYYAPWPEPGGMYSPKNLEFYWGVSGDLKTFDEWNVILLMEEILHQLISRMSPCFIRFHRFLPSTVLWYLQRKCRSSCLEKILFWLQVATITSTMHPLRWLKKLLVVSYLEVANSNSELLLLKSEAFD